MRPMTRLNRSTGNPMAQNLNPILLVLFLWVEALPGGCHWSGIIRRGNALRLTDLSGCANVSALFYNAEEKLERYNMPDTLKAQHTAHLTTGHALYSDMGHVLCSVIHDTCGWHDTVCGTSDAATVLVLFGVVSFLSLCFVLLCFGCVGLLVV